MQLGAATVTDSVQEGKRKQLVFNNEGGFQGLKRIFRAAMYFSFIEFNCPQEESTVVKKTILLH